MVQIAQVERFGGKFTNNKELAQYPGIAISITSFEADYQNSKGNPKYFDKGLNYKLEDRLVGDFLLYDASGNNVGEMKGAMWTSSKNAIRSLQPLVGQIVVVNVAKPDGYWNVNNVGGPLLDAIIADLEKRESEIESAMDDAPPF